MKSKPKCKCKRCGKLEKFRKLGRIIVSNVSHVLGLCGECVGKEAGL